MPSTLQINEWSLCSSCSKYWQTKLECVRGLKQYYDCLQKFPAPLCVLNEIGRKGRKERRKGKIQRNKPRGRERGGTLEPWECKWRRVPSRLSLNYAVKQSHSQLLLIFWWIREVMGMMGTLSLSLTWRVFHSYEEVLLEQRLFL